MTLTVISDSLRFVPPFNPASRAVITLYGSSNKWIVQTRELSPDSIVYRPARLVVAVKGIGRWAREVISHEYRLAEKKVLSKQEVDRARRENRCIQKKIDQRYDHELQQLAVKPEFIVLSQVIIDADLMGQFPVRIPSLRPNPFWLGIVRSIEIDVP